MSVVALELLTDAAATAGAIDPRESLSDADAQFILRRLNRMIGKWANEKLMIYENYLDPLPLTANQASYSTSLLAHSNPVQWDNVLVRLSNVDHVVDIVDQQTYNAIAYKPSPGIPRIMYPNTSWPNSTMFFFPVPFGPMTAYIGGQGRLAAALVLTDTIDFPPGYEAALVDNLAVDISPSYGLAPSPALMESASNAKLVLKRVNHVALMMDSGVRGKAGGTFNIFSGANE